MQNNVILEEKVLAEEEEKQIIIRKNTIGLSTENWKDLVTRVDVTCNYLGRLPQLQTNFMYFENNSKQLATLCLAKSNESLSIILDPLVWCFFSYTQWYIINEMNGTSMIHNFSQVTLLVHVVYQRIDERDFNIMQLYVLLP